MFCCIYVLFFFSFSGETLLSPLVMCGPHGLKFRKPIELRLPHKGASNDSMAFSLKSSDSPVGKLSNHSPYLCVLTLLVPRKSKVKVTLCQCEVKVTLCQCAPRLPASPPLITFHPFVVFGDCRNVCFHVECTPHPALKGLISIAFNLYRCPLSWHSIVLNKRFILFPG